MVSGSLPPPPGRPTMGCEWKSPCGVVGVTGECGDSGGGVLKPDAMLYRGCWAMPCCNLGCCWI